MVISLPQEGIGERPLSDPCVSTRNEDRYMTIRNVRIPHAEECEAEKLWHAINELQQLLSALEEDNSSTKKRVSILETKVEAQDERDCDRAVQRAMENRGLDHIDEE